VGVNRSELMAEIERRWRLIDDLVGDAGADALGRQAGGPEEPAEGWTVGEVLLHMAEWKRRALAIALLLADRPDAGDDEVNQLLFSDWSSFNAGHRDRAAGRGADEILTEHRAAHKELVAALGTLPDQCLLREDAPRAWLRQLMAHTFDHLDPDLRPALGA